VDIIGYFSHYSTKHLLNTYKGLDIMEITINDTYQVIEKVVSAGKFRAALCTKGVGRQKS
jgi:hypothetical protein